MDLQDVINCLSGHSNLPGTDLPAERSIVWRLLMADRAGSLPDISEQAQEVIGCLQEANRIINSSVWDGNFGARDSVALFAISELAYPVSGIITSGLKYHLLLGRHAAIPASDLRRVEVAIARISHAWDQVLAGDVQDVLEGFVLE